MSKKILFMSSAKLTAICFGLLLAVFCTIGMSFRPVYDENEAEEIVMSGPRRSHWTSDDGCGNTTYKNSSDSGKVTAHADGNGTVSASGTNANSATSGNGTATATVTWECGYTSDGNQSSNLTAAHTNEVTFTATPNPGYYSQGWYTATNKGGTKKSDGQSYNETFKISHDSYDGTQTAVSGENLGDRYAYFTAVQVSAVDNTTMSVSPSDPRTTCEDYAGQFIFTTVGADAMNDFDGDDVKQTAKIGNGVFAITTTPNLASNQVKGNWTFTGDGTYGGKSGTRTRQNSVTYQLKSKGDANSYRTCTITANFPNLSMSGEDVEVYTNYAAASPSAGTAVITLNYADDANDFVTDPASVTLSNIGGTNAEAGTWSLGEITMSETNYATGVATIEIPYTFTPAGKKKTGTVTADYKLTANSAAGGATFTLHFTAEVSAPETREASVTIGETTIAYNKLLGPGGALEAANATSNATLKLLKEVEITEPIVINKSMTFDLNSYTLTASLTSSATKVIEITNNAQVTLCTSRAGGKIIASGNYNGRLSGVEVTSGLLTYSSGSIELSNANTGTTEANRYAVGVYLASGGMIMSGSAAINVLRIGASGNYCYGVFCADGTAVDITGGTITATNENGGYAYGIWLQGQSPLNNVTVTATAKDHAFGVWTQSGEIVVEGGTYTATTTTSTLARAFLTRGEVNILGGTFTATAATNNAAAVYTFGGTTTIGGGTYTATAANTAYGIEMYTSGDKVKVNGGTFIATATTSNAAGVWVNNGTSLTTTTGTFTGIAQGTANNAQAYGVKVVAGGTATLKGATLRGTLEGVSTISSSSDQSKPYGAYGVLAEGALTIENCPLVKGLANKQYAYGVYATENTTIFGSTLEAETTTNDHASALYMNGSSKTVVSQNNTYSATAGTTYAYGAYILNGILEDANSSFTGYTKQTTTAASYSRGIYCRKDASILTLTGSTVTAKGTSGSQNAYALYCDGVTTLDGVTAVAVDVNSGSAIYTNGNNLTVNSGHYKGQTTALNVGGSSTGTVLLKAGYYSHKTNITAARMPEGHQVYDVPTGTEERANGYNYSIGTPDNPGFTVCKNVQKSKEYNTLAEALQEVAANQTILMLYDYTLPAGNYVLPANATLLVPYNASQTSAIGTTPSRADSYTTRSPFRTLTFASGAKMTVYGRIEASAQQNRTDQTSSGEVRGPFGYIILNEGASITLENGATLIAWGFVCGKGTITVKDGAKAYEMMSLGWYKGGNTTLKLYNNASYKVFVMTDYAYQNIECPITYYPGGQALGAASTDYFSPNDVELVGTTTTSFFKMVKEEASADTWVRKEYDPKTDLTTWTMNNGSSMSAIKLESYSSENYYLPITSNFRIIMNYGEMSLGGDIEFHAGSELIIKKEATGKIASGKTVVFYDDEDWRTGLGSSGKFYYPATYSPSWKAATGATTNPRLAKYKQTNSSTAPNYLPDASLNIQGKLEVSGYLYTTGDGNKSTENRNSNIYSSNEDAGKIIYNTSAPAHSSTKTMYKCTAMYGASSGKGIKDMLANGNSTAYPALLQNADGAYETTGGTTSGSSWIYKNDHWVMVTTEGCFSVEQVSGVKHYYAYPAGFVEVTSNTENPTTHLFYDAETEARAFIVDGDCVWWEVEPVPYDGNKYKCVNPDHNGKYKYYEYVSGWQEALAPITWKNETTTLKTYATSLYGTKPKYLDAIPTKAAATYVTYSWDGWLTEANMTHVIDAEPVDKSWRVLDNNDMPIATTATTYYAHYAIVPKQYYVKFYSENGASILQQGPQNAAAVEAPTVGLRPTFDGVTPAKEPTTAKEYSFYGWSTAADGGGTKYTPETLPVLTAVANYYACFTEQTRQYTITFANYNGDVLKTGKVAYGESPVAPTGEYAPTRANDAFWSYDFSGWDKEIRAVDGDETYTAQYTRTALVPKYTIRFLNWDGEVLYRATVEEGQTPVYVGETPIRIGYGYTYTFSGWGDITAATGNKDYTAQYNAVAEQFYITFLDEDGRQRERKLVDYNTMPEYTGSTLSKDPTIEETFVFDHWNPALAKVTGEATYTAVYAASPRKYTVTFWNYNQSVKLQETEEEYGSIPEYKAGEPIRPDDSYSYTFRGWQPAIHEVNSYQVYVPSFTQTGLGQPVVFKNYNTSTSAWDNIWTKSIPTGDAIIYKGATPERPSTNQWNYTFTGWSETANTTPGGSVLADLGTVPAGGKTFYAQFSQSTRTYQISFDLNGQAGTAPTTQTKEYGQKVTKPTNPTSTEYDFGGWYKEPACTNEWDFDNTTVTEAQVLYAKWTRKTYSFTIGVTPPGYGTVSASSVSNIPYGTSTSVSGNTFTVNGTTVTATPTAAGAQYTYTFKQWNNIPATVTTNVANIQAEFTRTVNKYYITFNLNGQSGTAPSPQQKSYGEKATQPSDPYAAGYTFGGWYKEPECTNEWNFGSTTVTGAQTLYAKWLKTYMLTASVTPAASGSIAPSVVSDIPEGTAISASGNTVTISGFGTLTATAADPTAQYTYAFKQWNNIPGSGTITANTNIQAEFTATIRSYDVTFDVQGKGSAPTKQTIEYEGKVVQPANPTTTGYTMTGWYKEPECTNAWDFAEDEVTGPTTLYASWTVNTHKLAWNFDGGTPSGAYTEANNALAYGSAITYPTLSKTGYTFAGWSTNATSMPDADLTITATWTANTNTAYAVEHYWQNIADNEYTKHETVNITGTTATATAAVAKSYTGFDAQSFSQGTIAPDGSTVVKIYYNRKTYTIKWVDGNGTTIETDENVKYGATPVYNGSTPTKDQTVEHTYTFNDTWSPAIGAVTGPQTYTAQFDEAWRLYDITWRGEGITQRTDQVAYGTTPEYGELPTKEPTKQQVFTYEWKNVANAEIGVKPVTGDATYEGSFTGSPRPYMITFVNDDNTTVLQATEVGYGSSPTYSGTPVSKIDASYEFIGWTPAIAEVTGEAKYVATYKRTVAPIEVTNGNTEPVSMDTETTKTTIHEGGTLEVASGKTLTTDVLILEASALNSGQITGAGNVEVTASTGKAYFDLTLNTDARHWHAFGVPWAVNLTTDPLTEVKTGRTLTLGSHYEIVYYDTDTRATQGPNANCWKYLKHYDQEGQPIEEMTPGQGYMIAFTCSVQTVRFVKKEGAPVFYNGEVTVSAVGEGTNRGINAVANPMAYHANMDLAGVGQVHDGGEIGSDGYSEVTIAGMNYIVGKTVYVQVDAEQTISVENSKISPAVAAAPARRAAKATDKKYLVLEDYYAVSLTNAGGMGTKLYVLPEEDKENKYVIGHDLVKMGMSTKKPQIWVNRYGVNLGLNTTAPVNETAEFPVNLYAPTAGDYTITNNQSPMTNDEYIVYLTQNGEAIWNLSDAPYVTSLPAGVNKTYGLRLTARKAPEVATGVDEAVVDAKNEIRKVLIDEKVFIIREGNVYSIDGQLVK